MKIQVEYRWVEGTTLVIPVILILWTLVVALVGTVRFLDGDVAAPILCLLLFFGGNYVAVAYLFNRTIISATQTQFEIRHEPVPWFREKQIDVSKIKSFSFKERGLAMPPSTYFTFFCNTVDSKKFSIFWGVNIPKPEKPMELLTRIREWLAPYRSIEMVKEKDWLSD